MTIFKRGIRKRDMLAALKADRMWNAINNDPELFVGIRNNYINAYFNGNNICRIRYDPREKRLIGEVHHKYLPRENSKTDSYYIDIFRNPIENCTNAIADIKKASTAYADDEKTHVHSVCIMEADVLDVEIAFSRINPKAIHGRTGRLDRLDYVKLEMKNAKPMLVFYEAKMFANSEIKARAQPHVFDQMRGYTETLHGHAEEIITSYNQVCANIQELGVRRKGTLIGMVHNDLTPDNINYEPRLIIFGYSKIKERSSWPGHYEKLKNELGERLILVGAESQL